ncbi:MAG: DUF4835 family protein [Bacteroidales bacterium]|jgi:hypothetical protein|nr:DUF4835 family protein [Bacteroidales bacterium]
MKRLFLIIFVLLNSYDIYSQEFKLSLSINSSKLQGTDKALYQNLQNVLTEFINDRKWTNYNYQTFEKIEANISFNLKEVVGREDFTADLTIQLRRPVYNSTYTTTLLNTQENDFKFKYIEGQPLQFDPTNYTDNLTSTIAFYLYYFLALDGDSFAPNGGSEYFQMCQNILNAAQRSSDAGWQRSFTNQQNRYWMLENYTNSSYSALHQAWYQYHRLGLDMMAGESQAEARNNIILAIENLQKVYREKSNLVALQQFFDAKADEIVNIFKGAPQNEQKRVAEIMKQINPSNTNKYDQITQGQNTGIGLGQPSTTFGK